MAVVQTPKEKVVKSVKQIEKPLLPNPEPQEYLMQFFEYGHLPPHMQDTSKQFHDLAHALIASVPRNPERTMALRRLLEAKDCAVRAKIFKQ